MDVIGLRALDELLVPPAVDVMLLEAIADHVHALREGAGVEGLARGQGFPVERDASIPQPFHGILWEGRITVRPRKEPSQEGVAIGHELAHGVAGRAGMRLAHPDVWRLTLAILAPLAIVRVHGASVGGLAAAASIPWWAAAARVREVFGEKAA